ncbi:MAG TPA: OmpA family protein, partial [Bacteroidia bacterium]|nr:OmpA family protein [Bacteroidia bacterium]
NTFVKRGATNPADGQHQIIISIRKDNTCECIAGRIEVKDGKIKQPLYVKNADGTYRVTQKKLSKNTGQGDHSFGQLATVVKGMSRTFQTSDYEVINLFFIECLNPLPATKTDVTNSDTANNSATKTAALAIANNLVFSTGSTDLQKSSIAGLEQLADAMTNEPATQISIVGHTDNDGSIAANIVLSENRALAVKAFLESKGIDSKRILTFGYGESKPIASNRTAAGRSLNRRIEIITQY